MSTDNISSSNGTQNNSKSIYTLSLLALGIVFGDIGTSPLYAIRECFAHESIPLTQENIFGVLSLIFWSLIIIISVKYLIYVMRADNEGEGGILALLMLVISGRNRQVRYRRILLFIGLFGSALFYGDGMLTPAISVLSAVEGLQVGTPALHPYIIPITITILVCLFIVQSRGTAAVGTIFGPIMLVWFTALGVLGLSEIIKVPVILTAINPVHAFLFFINNSFPGFLVLGAVFLVVTGGEALYADIGHFGKQPIRFAWFALVLPCLLLNYFGQGALLLSKPEAIKNPFYLLVPHSLLYPMIVLATAATIIASQAVISGAFSLTYQAQQLGYVPRLKILHTSSDEKGQVYVSIINWILLVGTVGLVLGFGSSDNLAGAYGVAIATLMIVTTILMYFCSRRKWQWGWIAKFVALFFLVFDLAYFGANLYKIPEGGWFPILIAAGIYLLITTWHSGREIIKKKFTDESESFDELLEEINSDSIQKVKGTAIYMSGNPKGIPITLQKNIEFNKIVHEQVVILTIVTEDVPRIARQKKLEIKELAPGFYRIIAHIGYVESQNVPSILRLADELLIDYDPFKTVYFLGRETLVASESTEMSRWRKKLFALMSRNAETAPLHFGIPTSRVIEIGTQVEI